MSSDVLSGPERDLVASLDPARIEADLAALVALPSVGGSAAEEDAQRWGAERMSALGADVDLWAIDLAKEAVAQGFPGMEVDRDHALGVVGVLGGSAAPGASAPALVFNGHTDVVPSGDLARWVADPYVMRVVEGRAIGRGTCDMKAGVVAALAAMEALARSGAPMARPLGVHLVSGEEDGGLGSFATLRRGHLAEACVIAEPTQGAIIPTNAGSLTFRLEFEGVSAHGATRTLGVSVVDLLPPVLDRLRRLEGARNKSVPAEFAHLDVAWPMSVGTVRAGDWASSVPDVLVAEGRYGIQPGELLADARTDFESAVAEAVDPQGWLRTHPVRVSWPGGVFAPGVSPAGHPLLGDVRAVAAAVGFARPQVRGAPYGSDLRLYTGRGIPTLQFGPGDLGDAHAAEESVNLADVLRCAQAYAVLAHRACVDG